MNEKTNRRDGTLASIRGQHLKVLWSGGQNDLSTQGIVMRKSSNKTTTPPMTNAGHLQYQHVSSIGSTHWT
jgi:hypothetical protein